MDEKNDFRKDRVGLYFSVFAVLLLILFLLLGLYIVRQRAIISPKASGSTIGSIVSLENSYIFASPVRAGAGGELIRITIFILDSQGRGIVNKKVFLGNSDQSLIIKELQSLTDETGKAVFDISSNTVGTFYLESSIEGNVLPQKVKVVFD